MASSTAKKRASGKTPRSRARSGGRRKGGDEPEAIPRAMSVAEDDESLMSAGAGHGAGFGRCGGRILGSKLEQTLCDQLTGRGIAHSHSPRHFEVRVAEKSVAAYAPMIVLRGRGREGKTVVVEAIEDPAKGLLRKIQAFRSQYGSEFYVIFVAGEEELERVPLSAHDESCTTNDLGTLINRLAE